ALEARPDGLERRGYFLAQLRQADPPQSGGGGPREAWWRGRLHPASPSPPWPINASAHAREPLDARRGKRARPPPLPPLPPARHGRPPWPPSRTAGGIARPPLRSDARCR